ncbi:hypothetical protein GIB67_018638 [Kingdonia uniflora]|uniref:Uncharacterized protein n=1 Tax=Kingdonia uniflora TaxID=39325 RepID=A0A7J7M2J8_9MAGN|nr:hypothetical protein GIB67_018638 [Kingdonia uniflora]
MLTVQQLQPNVTDIKYSIKNQKYVGYQEGSFVKGLLERLKFNDSFLKLYNLDDLEKYLLKGRRNGSITASFDEISYMDLFLTIYCAKYTKVGPTYKTDGFGFVFPRGSPLVPNILRAILYVTQG